MCRFFGEPSLVVFKQQPPRSRVLLHDLQHRPPLVGNQRVLRKRSSKQTHRLFDLAQPFFAEPLFIQRVAAQQVIFQCPRRPNAKLGATLRFNALAHGNNGVQAVENYGLI